MLIYCTPGTGKSTLCQKEGFVDGDDLLYAIFIDHFDSTVDRNDFAQSILCCFDIDRNGAEDCYTKYGNMLMQLKAKGEKTVFFGTRRFMHMANKVFLETSPVVLEQRGKTNADDIIRKEKELALRLRIQFTALQGRLIENVWVTKGQMQSQG